MNTWTPIASSSRGLVHITSMTDAHKTQCGKPCAGWKISLERVTCTKCKAAIHKPVRGYLEE